MNEIVFAELKALKQDVVRVLPVLLLAMKIVCAIKFTCSPGTRDFVFSVSKMGVNIDSIKTGWRNACAAAGLVDLRFHDTRHTFATRLRANGVHEWDIRDLLGHTTTRMTSVYTHQTPVNLRHAVTTLGQSKQGRVVRFTRKNRDSQRERKAG